MKKNCDFKDYTFNKTITIKHLFQQFIAREFLLLMKKKVKKIALILLGSLITAISLNLFLIPSQLLSGGVTGIAIILKHFYPINVGLSVFIMNIPLFIFAYKKIDRTFAFYSILGMISTSVFIILTTFLTKYCPTYDNLLNSIIGGVIGGIGSGIVFRQNACQGGTDILAVALNDKVSFNVATLGFIFSGIVIIISMFVTSIPSSLYTVVSMYINAIFTNKVIEGIESKKMLLIVTEHSELVAKTLNKGLGRGATLIYAEGCYSNQFKPIVYCIVTSVEFSQVISDIKEIDDKAFISVSDVNAVYGKGFKKPVFQ